MLVHSLAGLLSVSAEPMAVVESLSRAANNQFWASAVGASRAYAEIIPADSYPNQSSVGRRGASIDPQSSSECLQ